MTQASAGPGAGAVESGGSAGVPVLELQARSEEETRRLGRELGRLLRAGDVVALLGPLGAGKTTLTKGIAAALGLQEERIISPTFIYAREHRGGRVPLYHIDAYRLEGSDPLEVAAGLEAYLHGDGVAAVEWAEHLGEVLPGERLEVEIAYGEAPASRRIHLRGLGERGRNLARELASALGKQLATSVADGAGAGEGPVR